MGIAMRVRSLYSDGPDRSILMCVTDREQRGEVLRRWRSSVLSEQELENLSMERREISLHLSFLVCSPKCVARHSLTHLFVAQVCCEMIGHGSVDRSSGSFSVLLGDLIGLFD
jgi:hypothetical protein